MKVYFNPQTRILIVPYQSVMLCTVVPEPLGIVPVARDLMRKYREDRRINICAHPHEMPTLTDDSAPTPPTGDNTLSPTHDPKVRPAI